MFHPRSLCDLPTPPPLGQTPGSEPYIESEPRQQTDTAQCEAHRPICLSKAIFGQTVHTPAHWQQPEQATAKSCSSAATG